MTFIVMWTGRGFSAAAFVVALGCAACGTSDGRCSWCRGPAKAPATRLAGAGFRGSRIDAKVVPRAGDPHTVFRVRFRPREFVGRRAHALHGYTAHLRAEHDRASCIIDTAAYLDPRQPRRGIVLDPSEQMGGRWCRDRFRGSVIYYREYACPTHGPCEPSADSSDRRRRVARIAFTVR